MDVRDAPRPAPGGTNIPNITLKISPGSSNKCHPEKVRKSHLEVLGLDYLGEDEGADGEEGGKEEREDHLDVRPH